jgi:hypothetical protein
MESTNLSTAVIIDGIGGLVDGFIDGKTLKRDGIDGALANWDAVKDTEAMADEWPELPTADDATIELNQATVSAIVEALVATSDDNARPVLQAIELHDGAITSTDGYKLFSKGGGHKLDVLLPKEAAELIKLSKTLNGWYFGESANQITLKNDNLTIISRKIDGAYPKWRTLTPDTTAHRVVLDATEVYNAANILKDGGSLSLNIDGKGAATVENGAGRKIEVSIVKTEGPQNTNPNNIYIVMPLKSGGSEGVTLNPNYLKEATGKYKFICIDYNNNTAPTLVRGWEVCN